MALAGSSPTSTTARQGLPGSRVTAAATAARTFSETIFPSISSAGMGASRQR
jgi:hypothetical protein